MAALHLPTATNRRYGLNTSCGVASIFPLTFLAVYSYMYIGSLGNWWHEWKLEFGNYDRNTGWSDSKKLENCVCQAARPGLDGWSYIQQQRVHSRYFDNDI